MVFSLIPYLISPWDLKLFKFNCCVNFNDKHFQTRLLLSIVYNGLFLYSIEWGLKLIEVVRPIIWRFRKRLDEAENSFVNMNLYILLNQVGVKMMIFSLLKIQCI